MATVTEGTANKDHSNDIKRCAFLIALGVSFFMIVPFHIDNIIIAYVCEGYVKFSDNELKSAKKCNTQGVG